MDSSARLSKLLERGTGRSRRTSFAALPAAALPAAALPAAALPAAALPAAVITPVVMISHSLTR